MYQVWAKVEVKSSLTLTYLIDMNLGIIHLCVKHKYIYQRIFINQQIRERHNLDQNKINKPFSLK